MRRVLLTLLLGGTFLMGNACNEAVQTEPERPSSGEGSLGGSATSKSGRYRVELRPANPPVSIGALHEWVLELARSDGAPASPTTLQFDGGMPAHGHGFVTDPRVTKKLDEARFLIEGVKFHMGGVWELRVTLTDPEGRDQAVLQIEVAH